MTGERHPFDVWVEFRFHPFTQPHSGGGFRDEPRRAGGGYSGIGFTLASTAANGEVDVPGPFNVNVGDEIANTVGGRVQQLASTMITDIVDTISQPGLPRCAFVSRDQALDALPRQCETSGSESEYHVITRDGALEVILRSCQ